MLFSPGAVCILLLECIMLSSPLFLFCTIELLNHRRWVKGGGSNAVVRTDKDCSIQSAAQHTQDVWKRQSQAYVGSVLQSLVSACPSRRTEQRLIGGLQAVMVNSRQ